MTRDASKRLISATQMSPVTDSQLASGSDAIVDHQILKAQAQNTDAKLNAILKHLNIEAPPPTAAATVTSADAA